MGLCFDVCFESIVLKIWRLRMCRRVTPCAGKLCDGRIHVKGISMARADCQSNHFSRAIYETMALLSSM